MSVRYKSIQVQSKLRVLIKKSVVWIDKLHGCDERICFANNGFHGKRKKSDFPGIIATIAKGKKCFIKDMNF